MQLLEEIDGSIDGRPVDARFAFLRLIQKSCRIEMLGCVLNDFDQCAPLGGETDTFGRQFIQQQTAFEPRGCSCD